MIEELIGLAREMREANARGERLGLSDDELAFYDALGVNDSAVQVLGDETLRGIARELVENVRGNVTIDWTLRENVRANLRRLVKRVLRKHGYPVRLEFPIFSALRRGYAGVSVAVAAPSATGPARRGPLSRARPPGSVSRRGRCVGGRDPRWPRPA